MFKSIVIFTLLGSSVIQLDNKEDLFPTLEECYLAGAKLIRLTALSGPPLVAAHSFCVDIKTKNKEDEKEKKEEAPA